MHRREDVDAARGEHAGHLGDDPRCVRHEDQRVLVENDVELAVPERAEIAHVAADELELRAALPS
jgi:hypothetical protein